MLTKKQIEAIEIGGRDDEWEMSGDLSMDDARELRRLALLGLERDTRAERIGRAVLAWLAKGSADSVRATSSALSRRGMYGLVHLFDSIAEAMEDEP